MRKFLIVIFSVVIIGIGLWYAYTKTHHIQPGVPSITDFSSFFPVGDSSTPTPIPGIVTPAPTVGAQSTPPSHSPFSQVSPHPVAGYTIFTQPITTIIPPDPKIPKSKPVTQTTTKPVLRYVSRGNGYVYEVADDNIPLQISNVYIPNIYEATFTDKYTTAFLRFLRSDQRTIATYSVPIPPPNTDGTRTQKPGVYFPDNITALAPSPDGIQLARITNDASGAQLRITTSINTKPIDIIHTSFQEWLISWPTQKSIYLQTKPSAQVPGYLYRIDTTEKKLRRVLGDIDGLTTSVSPSGTYILYSQHSDRGFVTKLFNTKTNATRSLNLALLPEKCTWLKTEDLICAGNTSVPAGEYPDAWYQGTVSFSDQLYHIYTGTAVYDTIYDNSGQSFDMTSLSADESTRMLYFIDKPTGLLWKIAY